MTGSALVVGAGGAVGEAASLALAERGWRVTASMHAPRQDVADRLRGSGATVVSHDISRADASALWAHDVAIFTTRLDLTVSALERGRWSDDRLVVFSSNNVAVHPEAPAYRALARAEQKLQSLFPAAAILRPTLIYGDPRLPSITRVLSLARSFPVLPLPGSGRARVQPIFHEDLGRIAAALAMSDEAGVFAVGGPQVITMKEFFDAIVRAAGARCRVMPIPADVCAAAAPVLSLFGFTAEQGARVERDRVAVVQSPLPDGMAARVKLRDGLARLATAMGMRHRADHRPPA